MTIKRLHRKQSGLWLMVVTISLLALCISGCNSETGDVWKGDKYIYQNTLPCTDQPDEWMTIDGKITEQEWQDNSWMVYKTNGVSFSVTTEFTTNGIYIAGKAEDPFVYYHGPYDYKNNTCFELYLVCEDEKEVNSGASQFFRPSRIVRLHIDPMNTVSYTNVPCYTATQVDGTLNTVSESETHVTNGWSFESYISWEAIRLEDKYFAEDGIPDTMKMYVKYMMIDGENANKINVPLEPINTEFFRYDTYWHFGRQGLKGDYSSALLNNSPDGPAASDMLEYGLDSNGNLMVVSNETRTQVTWAQGKRSDTFMIEATFTPGPASGGRTALGFILYDLPNRTGGYNVFSANAGELKNSGILRLSSSRSTDGLQWLTDYSFNDIVKNNYVSPYGKGSVHLKLVKIGGYMYYFVDNEFYKAEFIDSMKGAVNVGLFFNTPGVATNYRYVDYSGKEDEALAIVRDYVYFVNLPGITTYGTVISDSTVVPQGNPVTINIYPSSGYVLGDIYNNGNSFINQITGTSYTFTPNEDVNVEAKFHRVDAKTEACKLTLRINDQDGNSLVGVSYMIRDDEGKIVYSGKDNGRGLIILSVPRKCTVQTDTQTHQFSGNYTMEIQKDGYVAQRLRIQTGEQEKLEETYVMEKFKYGTVVVNGKNTTDAAGVLSIIVDKELYYSPAKTISGREVSYHRDYIAKEYFATVNITSEKATGTPNVAGVAITKGGGETIFLKISPWGANQLYIHCGTTNGRDAAVSVSGFSHSHSSNGGEASFSVARRGDNVFVFNSDGELAIVLNDLGIHTVGNHEFVSKDLLEGTNANVANFFLMDNQDHAFGIYNDHNNGSASTYFDISWTSNEASVTNALEQVVFVPMNVAFDSSIVSVEYAGAYDPELGFISGATGYLYVKSNSENNAVEKLTITYTDGTQETVYAKFNSLTKKSEIQLNLPKRVSNVACTYGEVLNVSGMITAPENVAVNGTTITFIDKRTGSESAVTCGYDGSFSVDLFNSTYDVLAENMSWVASISNLAIKEKPVISLNLQQEKYYIGAGTANGIQLGSSNNVNAGVTVDSLDGNVMIPANNSSMMAVLGNQVYTGKDSFTYTIKVSGSNMPVSAGTNLGDTQIGLGFSDGTNWWVFFVKNGEKQGSSVGIGVWNSGFGGGDFVYHNTLSPNTIQANNQNHSVSADVVLTIEKTGNQLILYAGEGSQRVKLLVATADGYEYSDPNGTITNEKIENEQISKLGAFFDENKEFVLCLGSFYYNADVTFGVEVE